LTKVCSSRNLSSAWHFWQRNGHTQWT